MCGRFVRYSPLHDLAKEFNAQEPSFDLSPSYNIAPGHDIAIVLDDGVRRIAPCRWGFIPSWSKDPRSGYKMINARAETVAEKPSFRSAFRKTRILIPANGFYEWQKEGKSKIPQYIRIPSRALFGFAGLLSEWTSPEGSTICTCTIITTETNSALQKVHDRMPVILDRESEELWLDRDITEKEILNALLKPYCAEETASYQVAPAVNSPSYNSPGCIQPA